MAWLLCLRGPCTTLFAWTILVMPSIGAPAAWQALWQHACIQWVLTCRVCAMGAIVGCGQHCRGFDCSLQTFGEVPCVIPVRLTRGVLCPAHMSSGFGLIVHVDAIVSCLFLVGACSAFCSLGWVVMVCQLLLAVWLGLVMRLRFALLHYAYAPIQYSE